MSKTKELKDASASLRLKSIEILKCSIDYPIQAVSLTTFSFNISVENKADSDAKLLFVIVSVEIRSENENFLLGSLVASCIYSLLNYDEVIKVEDNGAVNTPTYLIELLNSLSISTIRGIMFSTFKGTFLSNALLPIIAPKQMTQISI